MKSKKSKSIVAIILSVAMLVCLAACSESNSSRKTSTNKTAGDSSGVNSGSLDHNDYDSDSGMSVNLPSAGGEIEYQETYEGDEYNNDNITITYYKNGYLLIEGTGVLPDVPNNTGKAWQNVRVAEIGEGITEIGQHFFANCENLESVKMPRTLESINPNAFYSCDSLHSVEIPENVDFIGGDAFVNCANLKEVYFSANVRYISEAFSYCGKLERFVVDEANEYFMADENGILYSKDGTELVKIPEGLHLTEFTVPSTVTTINEEAFNNLKSLEKLTIHSGVSEVGSRAINSMGDNLTIYIQNSASYVNSTWGSSWNNDHDVKVVYES